MIPIGKIDVTYVDHMGDDLTSVNAARVSFGKTSDWEDCTSGLCLPHKDVRLIKFLGEHGHDSPFNHSALSLHIRAPIFVARQLVKHEYLVMNEVSRRYIEDEPEIYTPVWRSKASDKKQGSGPNLDDPWVVGKIDEYMRDHADHSLDLYYYLLDKGVCPEQARMVLPLSTMTEWYWTGLLSSWAKMVNLRIQPDTQYETQLVARQVDEIASELWPHSWEALRGMVL